MQILEITSSADITSVPTEATKALVTSDRGTPLVKNCMLRTKLRGELGLIRLRRTGSPIRLSVSRSQLLTVCCPISSKIASKASVTFARSSSEITLLSDSGCILSFCGREDYVEPGVANRRSGAEGGHPSL